MLAGALDHYTEYLHGRFVGAGWGSVSVEADGDTWTLGDGPVVATVSGPAYDVLRSVCARRSTTQIRALAWTGDVDGFLTTLTSVLYGTYSVPEADQP